LFGCIAYRDRKFVGVFAAFSLQLLSDWDDNAQKEEIKQRKTVIMYICNHTKMEGVYSIAELIDDSNKRPEKRVSTR
jgi:NTP pyrophosphatase (non-canonical NTP hydrolase)